MSKNKVYFFAQVVYRNCFKSTDKIDLKAAINTLCWIQEDPEVQDWFIQHGFAEWDDDGVLDPPIRLEIERVETLKYLWRIVDPSFCPKFFDFLDSLMEERGLK